MSQNYEEIELTEQKYEDMLNDIYGMVEDLPVLLSKVYNMERGDPPFSARSNYDRDGTLRVEFGK